MSEKDEFLCLHAGVPRTAGTSRSSSFLTLCRPAGYQWIVILG
jgi:hypothetical protein